MEQFCSNYLFYKFILKHSVLTHFIHRTRPALPDLRDEFESTSIFLIIGYVIVTFNTFENNKSAISRR